MAMPLSFSVSRGAIEPTIVTSSPSRIQTAPSPITTRQWKLDHGRRSRRPGMLVSIVAVWALKVRRGYHGARKGNLPGSGANRMHGVRPPLPVHRRWSDDALGLRALRHGCDEEVREAGGRGPLRRGVRP